MCGVASKTEDRRNKLVDEFVACFEKLDEMTADEILNPAAWKLAVGEPGALGRRTWQPLRVEAERSDLDALYGGLPARLGTAFERLLLAYRWAEVDLETFTLMANPPGANLEGFLQGISRDKNLWKELIPAG